MATTKETPKTLTKGINHFCVSSDNLTVTGAAGAAGAAGGVAEALGVTTMVVLSGTSFGPK
jgi:hypothetical protein